MEASCTITEDDEFSYPGFIKYKDARQGAAALIRQSCALELGRPMREGEELPPGVARVVETAIRDIYDKGKLWHDRPCPERNNGPWTAAGATIHQSLHYCSLALLEPEDDRFMKKIVYEYLDAESCYPEGMKRRIEQYTRSPIYKKNVGAEVEARSMAVGCEAHRLEDPSIAYAEELLMGCADKWIAEHGFLEMLTNEEAADVLPSDTGTGFGLFGLRKSEA